MALPEFATLRDLRRDVRKRFHALVVAPNANLPDKFSDRYDEAVADLIEAAATYGEQLALRGLLDAIRTTLATKNIDRATGVLGVFADELERAILPLAPPDPEEGNPA